MVIKINKNIVTAIGNNVTMVQDTVYGTMNKAIGIKQVIKALFKYDKGMKNLLLGLLPNEGKCRINDVNKIVYEDYTFKKLAINSYMLSKGNRQLKEFSSPLKGLEYLFDIIVCSSDKTFLKIEKFINFIAEVDKQLLPKIDNKQ